MAPPPSPLAEFPMKVQPVIVRMSPVLLVKSIAPPLPLTVFPMNVQSITVGFPPLIAAPDPAMFSMNAQLLTV